MPEDIGKRDRRMAAYQSTPEQKKRRAARNAARRKLIKEGVVKKGDGKEVHHERMLSKGGTNSRSNLKVVPRSKNRAHGTSRGGGRRKS